jgi:NAD(P)-dependent dehydrogenase (short-subunit alcohol dehydrogenase family)
MEQAERRPRALVTGGTRGIGKAICVELARAGFDVAFTGRTLHEGEGREEDETGRSTPLPGSLEATRAEVESQGAAALAVRLDLLDPASVDAGVESVLSAWGGVDVLVNNAMYEMGRYTNAWIRDTPIAEFQAKIQANFLAPVALIQHCLPGMLERGEGRVINLSTRHNYQRQGGPPGQGGAGVSYNCSKAACGKLADGLAAEHGPDGILAFDLDPGPVMTERFHTQGHRLGYPAALFCPIEVPAVATRWLATEAEAARYNGQHFMAQEFVRARGLHPDWESVLPMSRRWSPTAILDWREPGRPS